MWKKDDEEYEYITELYNSYLEVEDMENDSRINYEIKEVSSSSKEIS